jgi:hypothetical protein
MGEAKPRRRGVRAFLIDPEQRAIREFSFEGNYRTIQTILKCHSFTAGSRPLNGSLAEGFDTLYVSDDDLEDRENPRFWFQVDAGRDPPSSYPLNGLGMVIGIDDRGESCDARISAEELSRRITFTQRKFRGFRMFTGEEALARGAHLVIETEAPVIDGTDEKKSR